MSEAGPVRHRVVVPLGGLSVGEARQRAESLGLDPDSRVAVLVGGLEQVDTGWEVQVTFEVGASGVVPVAVEVRSTIGLPLTRAVWDRVRVGQVIDEAAALVSWLGPVAKRPVDVSPFESRPQRRGRGKGRPAVYSDEHYRRVAAVYLAAEQAGRAPVRAVAAAFATAFPGLTEPTDRRARAWVRAARARGYITTKDTTKGGDQ